MSALAERWADLQAAARSLPFGARVWIVVGAAALGVAIAFMAPVDIQDEAYHNFARSGLFGIKHFGIVASNFAFLVVGIWGLWVVSGETFAHASFRAPAERWPYLVFFAGVVLVTFGSAYYHADPTTETLLWDRLAMTIIFMALFAAVIADRIDLSVGVRVMLPALLFLGAASMVHWHQTGDLRLYRVVEILPMALILLICLLFPGRLTRLKYVVWMGLWFGLATIVETFDKEIFAWISIGGHTIKHPVAAVAPYLVIAMLQDATRRLKTV